MIYLWLKALHLIFGIGWMAGIFYLPRLMVNTVLSQDKPTKQRLIHMAQKLDRFGTILMLVTLLFGLSLFYYNPDLLKQPWMHGKLTLLVLLIAYQHISHRLVGNLKKNIEYTALFYRAYNEISIILLAGIVILAVVRPWG